MIPYLSLQDQFPDTLERRAERDRLDWESAEYQASMADDLETETEGTDNDN